MAKRMQIKLIMQLRAARLFQSEIARTHHMSKSSVGGVFRIAKEHQISYEDLKDKPAGECYQLCYPDRKTGAGLRATGPCF